MTFITDKDGPRGSDNTHDCMSFQLFHLNPDDVRSSPQRLFLFSIQQSVSRQQKCAQFKATITEARKPKLQARQC